MLIENNDLITAKELADLKGVTRKTVYKWLSEGIAPAHKMYLGMHFFEREAAVAFNAPTRGRKKSD